MLRTPRARAGRAAVTALSVATLTIGVLGAATQPASAAPARSTVGGNGAGDPYFPLQGNTGYDVKHYWIHLRYAPRRDQGLTGRVKILAVAHQRLTRFNLDLRPAMTAHSVKVDGARAGFTQPRRGAHELVIHPSRALRSGQKFWVAIDYSGHGRTILDPDGSQDGWIKTDDGAFVANEPQGTPSWYPVNDTPRDKAKYSTWVDVPRGLVAMSNGALVSRRSQGKRTVWAWQMRQPISSYLVTATVGKFDLHFGRVAGVGRHGVPYVVAIDPTQRTGTHRVLSLLPRIIRFFSAKYGRYPFGQVGAIVDHAPGVGYALETATRPLFPGTPSVGTLAHELAHQWYGDTVTCRYWRDIWVNEGFAEFSAWLWEAHTGGRSLRAHLQDLLSNPPDSSVWNPPPGNPGSNTDIFAGSVYDRGAGALEALREKVGSATFFTIMRGWVRAHHFGNASPHQFARYAAKVAHQDLTHLFHIWLFRPGKP